MSLGPFSPLVLSVPTGNRWMELLEEAVRNATRHPGAAPTPVHPPPPGPQEPAHQSPTPSRCLGPQPPQHPHSKPPVCCF